VIGACLAFMMVGDDGLDHRKLPIEDQAGIENVDSRKLPRDGRSRRQRAFIVDSSPSHPYAGPSKGVGGRDH
jgi:hypothetical protein